MTLKCVKSYYHIIPFTDGGGKTEQIKEPEPAAAPQAEKKDQPDDKKVHSNHVLVVFKKPRSESLIPVYVRVNVQSSTFGN